MIDHASPPLMNSPMDIVLRIRLDGVRTEASQLSTDALRQSSTEELCGDLYDKHKADLPVLKTAPTEISQSAPEEISLRVVNFGGALDVKGRRHRFFVPFVGDPVFFRYHGSTFSVNPPRAAVNIDTRELVFGFDTDSASAQELEGAFRQQLQLVESNLRNMRDQVDAYNRELPEVARSVIEARRAQVAETEQVTAHLGYKTRG